MGKKVSYFLQVRAWCCALNREIMGTSCLIMKPENNELLNQPVSELSLSEASKAYLNSLHIGTLGDFVSKGWAYFQTADRLNPRSFNEVISLLRDRKLLHYMEGL